MPKEPLPPVLPGVGGDADVAAGDRRRRRADRARVSAAAERLQSAVPLVGHRKADPEMLMAVGTRTLTRQYGTAEAPVPAIAVDTLRMVAANGRMVVRHQRDGIPMPALVHAVTGGIWACASTAKNDTAAMTTPTRKSGPVSGDGSSRFRSGLSDAMGLLLTGVNFGVAGAWKPPGGEFQAPPSLRDETYFSMVCGGGTRFSQYTRSGAAGTWDASPFERTNSAAREQLPAGMFHQFAVIG